MISFEVIGDKLRIAGPTHLLKMVPKGGFEDVYPVVHKDDVIDIPPSIFTLLVGGNKVELVFTGRAVHRLDEDEVEVEFLAG